MRTSTSRRVGVVAVVAAAGFFVAGGDAGASTQMRPQRGGTLTITKVAEQGVGYDPIKLSGNFSQDPVATAVFDKLLYENPTTFAVVPRLAISMLSSNGGTNWTLKLRPKVKFSDGTSFDASAVMFNWQRIADPANNAASAKSASEIQAMQVVDPLTLRVTLTAPDNYFDHQVAEHIAWIASPAALKAPGADFAAHPVGAGPFTVQTLVRDSQTTLVRNPNYWQKGRPYLDQVLVKIIIDPTQAFNTLQSGSSQVHQNVSNPVTAAQARQAGFKVVQEGGSTGGGYAFYMNNAKAPFNDVRVRKAIDLAIDRDQFNQTLKGGSPDTLLITIDSRGTPYYDPTIRVPKYNLAEAQKLVDQVVAETGKPIEFTFSAYQFADLQADAQQLQAQVSKLKNVEMKLDVVSSSTIIQRFTTGSFQAYLGTARWNVPAIDMVQAFSSNGLLNYGHYSNSAVDAELQQLANTTDEKAQVQLVHQVEQKVLKDSGVIWVYRFVNFQFHAKSVQNFEDAYPNVPLLDGIWLSGSR